MRLTLHLEVNKTANNYEIQISTLFIATQLYTFFMNLNHPGMF